MYNYERTKKSYDYMKEQGGNVLCVYVYIVCGSLNHSGSERVQTLPLW